MTSDEPDPCILTDAEIDALMPSHEDFMHAKIFTQAWANGQYYIIRESMHYAAKRNPTGFITALAELLVHGYDLRDNDEAQAAWRNDIEMHELSAAVEKELRNE